MGRSKNRGGMEKSQMTCAKSVMAKGGEYRTIPSSDNDNGKKKERHMRSAASNSGRSNESRMPRKKTTGTTTMTAVEFKTKNGGGGKELSIEAQEELYKVMGRTMTMYPWYHGLMPRVDCEEILKEDGDFLIRKTTKDNRPMYCISVKYQGQAKHHVMKYQNALWSVTDNEDDSKGQIKDLLEHLINKKRPLPPSGAILKCSVPRPDFYLLHENIKTDKKLGAGKFGEVFIGTLKKENGEEMAVAVKTIKGKIKKSMVAEFIAEAKLMRRFDHPNIVRMWGVAPQEEPIMIVLEIAKGGSLKGYLHRQYRDVPEEALLGFARDAARGMCYLSLSQVIHRDLAARNCLLGGTMEVKISDFGMSVADTPEVKATQLKNVPIKWLAPETIKQGIFSVKTDAWSFGVLLWEIFARCQSDPFPGENNAHAKEKILSEHDPMEAPEESPGIVKEVMKDCFKKDPTKRADFVLILHKLAPEERPPVPAPKI